MNRLLDMRQARELLALQGRSLQWVRRRLRQIADARGATQFQLFELGNRWFTTQRDLRRLLPELFVHELDDAEELRARVESQASELEALRRRVDTLENRALRQRTPA